MKPLAITNLAFSAIFLYAACSKSSSTAAKNNISYASTNPNDSTISGSWNIVADTSFGGIGINNGEYDYTGQPGDYFDLRTDSTIYSSEHGVLDSFSYKHLSDTSIAISPFGQNLSAFAQPAYIRALTVHSVAIITPVFFSPAGKQGRLLHLAR